jgi:hypothetical protein
MRPDRAPLLPIAMSSFPSAIAIAAAGRIEGRLSIVL